MNQARGPVRFLAFAYADAATNMAVDEAVLEAYLAGLAPPTLRLYGFDPPAEVLDLPIGISRAARPRTRTRRAIVRQPGASRMCRRSLSTRRRLLREGEDDVPAGPLHREPDRSRRVLACAGAHGQLR